MVKSIVPQNPRPREALVFPLLHQKRGGEG